MNLEVICLESEALYVLIDTVVDRIKIDKTKGKDKWLTPEQAMKTLNVSSTTTMQKLRDEGRIRFTQPSRKNILYDRESIEAYLNRHTRDTF